MQSPKPYRKYIPITPDNDDPVPPVVALYVGSTGNLSVVDREGNTRVFVGVPAGAVLEISPDRILEATTADDIVGLTY